MIEVLVTLLKLETELTAAPARRLAVSRRSSSRRNGGATKSRGCRSRKRKKHRAARQGIATAEPSQAGTVLDVFVALLIQSSRPDRRAG